MSSRDHLCPACGEPNRCGLVEASDTSTSTCWCFSVVIDQALLDRLPPASRNRTCLCQACAMAGTPVASVDSKNT
ncbi:cysteine-rich CWC family protein [Stutzerimonas tarimensis]|uniref:Cysteine-rich CWC family protein n=1 Tax=Stutzerimonas tarimensis TaxID=1507735 RepID=A0ABV7T7M0_9GAMM